MIGMFLTQPGGLAVPSQLGEGWGERSELVSNGGHRFFYQDIGYGDHMIQDNPT